MKTLLIVLFSPPMTQSGAVCIHSWCCSGVPHLWGHPDPSLRTCQCHWEAEAEGQQNWEDRIWDSIPCMLQWHHSFVPICAFINVVWF